MSTTKGPPFKAILKIYYLYILYFEKEREVKEREKANEKALRVWRRLRTFPEVFSFESNDLIKSL